MSKLYLFDKFKGLDIFQKEIGYFLAICETSNISKASELLGIQQSGLSRALHRLESEVGQKLFHRKNTGLTLTDTGQRFLGSLRETKSHWDKSFRLLIEDQSLLTGRIRFGLQPSFGQIFLPKIVKVIIDDFQDVELEVQPLPSHNIIRKILADELDFGIVAVKPKQPELISREIGEDALGLFKTETSIQSKFLLFNPETQMSNAHLRRFSHLKKVAIKDYDLLAKTALATDIPTLLPLSVASSFTQLKQSGPLLAKAKLVLIAHQSKSRSNSYKVLWEKLLAAIHRPRIESS